MPPRAPTPNNDEADVPLQQRRFAMIAPNAFKLSNEDSVKDSTRSKNNNCNNTRVATPTATTATVTTMTTTATKVRYKGVVPLELRPPQQQHTSSSSFPPRTPARPPPAPPPPPPRSPLAHPAAAATCTTTSAAAAAVAVAVVVRHCWGEPMPPPPSPAHHSVLVSVETKDSAPPAPKGGAVSDANAAAAAANAPVRRASEAPSESWSCRGAAVVADVDDDAARALVQLATAAVHGLGNSSNHHHHHHYHNSKRLTTTTTGGGGVAAAAPPPSLSFISYSSSSAAPGGRQRTGASTADGPPSSSPATRKAPPPRDVVVAVAHHLPAASIAAVHHRSDGGRAVVGGWPDTATAVVVAGVARPTPCRRHTPKSGRDHGGPPRPLIPHSRNLSETDRPDQLSESESSSAAPPRSDPDSHGRRLEAGAGNDPAASAPTEQHQSLPGNSGNGSGRESDEQWLDRLRAKGIRIVEEPPPSAMPLAAAGAGSRTPRLFPIPPGRVHCSSAVRGSSTVDVVHGSANVAVADQSLAGTATLAAANEPAVAIDETARGMPKPFPPPPPSPLHGMGTPPAVLCPAPRPDAGVAARAAVSRPGIPGAAAAGPEPLLVSPPAVRALAVPRATAIRGAVLAANPVLPDARAVATASPPLISGDGPAGSVEGTPVCTLAAIPSGVSGNATDKNACPAPRPHSGVDTNASVRRPVVPGSAAVPESLLSPPAIRTRAVPWTAALRGAVIVANSEMADARAVATASPPQISGDGPAGSIEGTPVYTLATTPSGASGNATDKKGHPAPRPHSGVEAHAAVRRPVVPGSAAVPESLLFPPAIRTRAVPWTAALRGAVIVADPEVLDARVATASPPQISSDGPAGSIEGIPMRTLAAILLDKVGNVCLPVTAYDNAQTSRRDSTIGMTDSRNELESCATVDSLPMAASTNTIQHGALATLCGVGTQRTTEYELPLLTITTRAIPFETAMVGALGPNETLARQRCATGQPPRAASSAAAAVATTTAHSCKRNRRSTRRDSAPTAVRSAVMLTGNASVEVAITEPKLWARSVSLTAPRVRSSQYTTTTTATKLLTPVSLPAIQAPVTTSYCAASDTGRGGRTRSARSWRSGAKRKRSPPSGNCSLAESHGLEEGSTEGRMAIDDGANDIAGAACQAVDASTSIVPTYPIGTKVIKFFPGHGTFQGEVARFRTNEKGCVYLVRYDDGDSEELYGSALAEIAVAPSPSPTKKLDCSTSKLTKEPSMICFRMHTLHGLAEAKSASCT